MTDFAVIGFAFALGLGTFFSPCAVALVPSYAAYFVGTTGRSGLLAGLRFGAWAAAGVLAIFLVAATALAAVRAVIYVDSETLGSTAAGLGLAIGLTFLVLGVLVAVGRAPSWTPKLNRVLERTPRGMFLWGLLFGVGSLGCSLPLALAALALVLGSGATGIFVLGAYAAGLAGLVFVAGPILGVAGPALGRLMARSARPIQITMGLVLAASGLYVTWYYAKQFV